MNTIAYILILLGVMTFRAISRGRSVADLPKDWGDAVIAFVVGDNAALREALGRTGPVVSSDARTGGAGSIADQSTGSWTGSFKSYGDYLIKRYGIVIREMPPFDPVERVHVTNSDHYKRSADGYGKAMDISGKPKTVLDKVAADARSRKGFFVIWQAPGHYDHVHVSDRR